MSERPTILVSNDDGHSRRGIRVIAEALHQLGDVIIVAPEQEQSASSHALSLHRPLRIRSVEPGIFGVDGTPADCVYLALHAGTRILPKRAALAVSGINHGVNLGQDVFYSGTVAAAREAAFRGVPAIAVSADTKADLEAVAALTVRVARVLLEAPVSPTPLINLNVPAAWTGEVRTTRLGARLYDEIVSFRNDPRGREYVWLGGPAVRHEPNEGTDTDAHDACAASITPLLLDLTAYSSSDFALALAKRAINP